MDSVSSIFVSIASYRDPAIDKTLSQVIDNSSGEINIKCVVCLQDEQAEYDRLKNKFPEVTFIFIPYKKAKGVCYARSQIQRFITDQTHYLQLDSHMLLSENWDKEMLNSLENTYDRKGLLSCYPPGFTPDDPDKREKNYSSLGFYKDITSFKSTHSQFRAGCSKNKTGVPIRAMHVSGAFIFAPIDWCKNIGYPRSLYYLGEEDWLRIKTFTNGWNVYCPEKAYIWHDYNTSTERRRHWEDNGISTDNSFDIRTIRPGQHRSMKDYMIAMKQFTESYKEVIVPNKEKMIADLKPRRLHLTLYYHDSKMIQLHADCEKSLDPKSPIVKFDCSFNTLCMATKYRVECISSDGSKAMYLEHNYLE